MIVALAAAILASSAAWAVSPDSPQSCPSYDYSARFGPVRDQDGHGLCWAFTSAALLEEEACLEHLPSCGSALSPIDASRCDWHVGSAHEGGYIQQALSCGLGHGACTENDAPFFTKQETRNALGCFGELVTGQRALGPSCFTGELLGFYRRWKSRVSAHDVCEFRREPLERDTRFPGIVRLLHEYSGIDRRLEDWGLDPQVDILSALTDSASEGDFLRHVLIPPGCEENRSTFTKGPDRVHSFSWSAAEMRDHLLRTPEANARFWRGRLAEAFSHGHSAGLSFCTEMDTSAFARKLRAVFPSYGASCGAHAIVANGMRWNAGAHRCEVHLRNSWGEDAPYNGWVGADEFLTTTFGVTYIE